MADEDPAAAFLAQQESEIAGIENDGEGLEGPDGADSQPQAPPRPPSADYGGFSPPLHPHTLSRIGSPHGPGASWVIVPR